MYKFLCELKFSFFWSVGLKTYCKGVFKLLRKCHIVFQNCCTILHSNQQWVRVPVALHPYSHLPMSSFSYLKILAVVIGVRWYLLVLIYITLIVNDAEHLFKFFFCFFFFMFFFPSLYPLW